MPWMFVVTQCTHLVWPQQMAKLLQGEWLMLLFKINWAYNDIDY